MKYDNQLRYASRIVESFDGHLPLHAWLKIFFRENKQMGASDRRQVSSLVYGYYRVGHLFKERSSEEKILAGFFACTASSSALLQHLHPDWNERSGLPALEKCLWLDPYFSLTAIFPWAGALSNGVDHAQFCASFLEQPGLFIRVRPGMDVLVRKKLHQAGLAYRQLNGSCIVLPNGSKADQVLQLDKEAVIQDYSSQQTGRFLHPPDGVARQWQAWDCCAGSGGKSILLHDLHPSARITVSDIRESILVNLKKRFAEAEIKNYRSFVVNLADDASVAMLNPPNLPEQPDLLIADVPCSGSGTWARTPEACFFFKEESIAAYAERQRKIAVHARSALKKGGRLVYLTCSVFKKENEEMADFISTHCDLQLEKMELLTGYAHHADTLFAARFIA